MLISKDTVVQTLRAYGLMEQADRAEGSLPVQVDTQRDADVLRGLGLDPDRRVGGGQLAKSTR